MANNVVAEAVVSSGVKFLAAEVTGYGDANTYIPGSFLAIVSGSEGSQTFAEVVGGAGVVSAGVQRVTLASDDPAVALLTTIDADTGTLAVVGGGVEATALRVTIASDSTGVLSIDDNGSTISIDDGGGAITVDGTVAVSGTVTVDLGANNDVTVTGTVDLGATDNAVLDQIVTNTTGLAGTVSGSELQVDVVAALPAGTNNIGDVDVLSVVPGTAATNLGKAEDAVHTTGDVGVMALGVRQSSQADFGADGDYVPFSVDDDGGLRVSIVAGAGSGGTASADDADFSAGTTSGTPAMGVYESSPSSVTDGDMGMVGITQTRALRVNVDNTVTVASHAVTNAGTFAVQAAQSGTWTVDLGATDNAVLDAIAASVAGTLTVGSHAVTNAGTFAVQESGGALTALQIMDDWDNAASDGASVSGDTAHDAADAGEPVKIGHKATTSLSGLTLVAANDRTNAFAGVDGVPIVRLHTNLEDIVTGVAAITDGSSTSVIASAGAGVKIYITEVIIANSSASNVTVDLRDGAAGSVKATFSAPATSGSHKTLSTPLPFSAATAVCADPSAAASTVTVTLVGFKSKV